MPIYRYRNLTTNETFELEQRITESALTQDPKTGDPVKRLIQPVGIAFKGSGFYVNDSRKDSAGKASGSKDKSEAKADNKSEGKGKSDTKSDSKSDSKSDKTPAKTDKGSSVRS